MKVFAITFLLIAINISAFGQANPKKFSVGGHFGISSLAMNDMNTFMEKNFNDAGFNFDPIGYSLNTGAQANYFLNDKLGLRIGFGYYFPKKQSGSISFIQDDYLGSTLKINIATRGLDIYIEPVFRFMQTERFSFLAGFGILYSNAYLEMTSMDKDLDYDNYQKWKNNSFGLKLNTDLEYYLNQFLSVFGSLEFRYMNIPDLKGDDGEKIVISGEVLANKTISLDYSGIELSAGLLIYPLNIKQPK